MAFHTILGGSGGASGSAVNLQNGTAVLGGDFDITNTGGITSFQDTGLTISVPSAGRWKISASVSGRIGDGADDGMGIGVVITTSGNAIINDGETQFIKSGWDGSAVTNSIGYRGSAYLVAYVTTSGPATYKLRASQFSNSPANLILGTSEMRYEQLQTQEVVDASAVVVEPLQSEIFAKQTGLGFSTYSLDNSATWNDVISEYEYLRFNFEVDITGVTDDTLRTITIKCDDIRDDTRFRFEYGSAFIDLTFGVLTGGDFGLTGGTIDEIGLHIVGVRSLKTVISTNVPVEIAGITDGDAIVWNETNSQFEVGESFSTTFIAEGDVSPLVAGSPTLAEVQTWVTSQSFKSTLLYYNGTDVDNIATSTSFYVVNASGVAATLSGENQVPQTVNFDMDLDDITVSGATKVLSTTAGTGQLALHNDGTATLIRVGTTAICTLRMTLDDDSQIGVIMGTSIVPSGGKILSVASSSPTANENSDIIVRRNNVSPNELLINRNDSMNADTNVEVIFITDGWPNIATVSEGVVDAELYQARFSLSADATGIVCPFDEGQGDTTEIVNTGGTITLPVGKYRIVTHATRQGAILDYELYNVTDAVTLERFTVRETDVGSNGSMMPYYLTVTTPIDIQVREGDGGTSITWNGREAGIDAGFNDSMVSYGCWIDIQQVRSSESVASVEIDDQSLSNYIDIGDVRQQWGTSTSTGTTIHTVTFPVEFSNTNYSITCQTTNGGNGQTISVQSKSTTGFSVTTVDVNGTPRNNSFDWQAIGLKA